MNSYIQIYLHLVWGTWDRYPMIESAWERDLWREIQNEVVKQNGRLLALGGIEDHVHLLIQFRSTLTVADFIQIVKGASSRGEGQYSDEKEWSRRYNGWNLSFVLPRRNVFTERCFSVVNENADKPLESSTWQWTDIRNGRLLWTSEGKIFAAQLSPDSHSPIKELIDLDSWQFEPVKAPY